MDPTPELSPVGAYPATFEIAPFGRSQTRVLTHMEPRPISYASESGASSLVSPISVRDLATSTPMSPNASSSSSASSIASSSKPPNQSPYQSHHSHARHRIGKYSPHSHYGLPDPESFGEPAQPRLSYSTSVNSTRTSDGIRDYNEDGHEVTVRIRQTSNGNSTYLDSVDRESEFIMEDEYTRVSRARNGSDPKQIRNIFQQPPLPASTNGFLPHHDRTPLAGVTPQITPPRARRRTSRPILTDDYVRRAMSPQPSERNPHVDGLAQHFDSLITTMDDKSQEPPHALDPIIPNFHLNADIRAEMDPRLLSRSNTLSSMASSRFEYDQRRPSLVSRNDSSMDHHPLPWSGDDSEADQGESSSIGFSRSASTSSQARRFRENFEFHYNGAESSFASEANPSRDPYSGQRAYITIKEKVLDFDTVRRWDGIESLIERLESETRGQYDGGVLEDLSGTTRVSLPEMDDPRLPTLLDLLLPVVSSSLESLDISHSNLRYLPDALQACQFLQELEVGGNPLAVLPSWVSRFSSLRKLDVDGCRLRALPGDLVNCRNLRTINARNNRFISLPAWLSQLPRLETLLVDGNSFVGLWKTLVEAISSPVKTASEDVPPVPPVPAEYSQTPALSSSSERGAPTSDDARPFLQRSGSATSTSSRREPGTDSLMIQSAASTDALATPNAFRDHLPSATLSQVIDLTNSPRPLDTPGFPEPLDRAKPNKYPELGAGAKRNVVRRMRSAGALLTTFVGDRNASDSSGRSKNAALPPLPDRMAQPRSTTAMSNRAELSTSPVAHKQSVAKPAPPTLKADAAPTTNAEKPKKWGFLRKMSMHKLRAEKPAAKSQKADLPPLPIANEILPPHRPALTVASNSSPAVPLVASSAVETKIQPRSGFETQRSVSDNAATIPRSGKHINVARDPLTLHIAIPTTSPFLPPTTIFNDITSLPPQDEKEDPQPDRSSHVGSPALSSTPGSSVPARSYALGLKSIMSYLRDLYDLSLPIPSLGLGAEIVHSDSIAGSLTSTIDGRPISPSLKSSSRGTQNTQKPLPTGSPPDMESNAASSMPSSRRQSEAEASPRDNLPRKRSNDDSKVRTGVIKHIVDTERTYVSGLQDLVNIYVTPASQPYGAKPTGETVVPLSERKIVFGGVEGILRFHLDSFLPALLNASENLLQQGDDEEGERSKLCARRIAGVFRMYHPFMRQYSAYINNFDYCLTRVASWAVTPAEKAGSLQSNSSSLSPASSSASLAAGLAGQAGSTPAAHGTSTPPVPQPNLTFAQKKRIKQFLQLEDLARSTPVLAGEDFTADPIEDALQEMLALASSMNEEKRDSESRRRLVQWQSRIKGKFATPLVQAHRRLLMEGSLRVNRIVKKTAIFVEASPDQIHVVNHDSAVSTPNSSPMVPSRTHGPSHETKTIVQIDSLHSEAPDRQVSVCLTSDLMVLCKDPSGGRDPNSTVELYAVLKLQTKTQPASVVHGSVFRVVDNKASSPTEAFEWSRAINEQFEAVR